MLKGVFGSTMGVLAPLAAVASGVAYLMPAREVDEEWLDAGEPASYAEGEVKFIPTAGIFVARSERGFIALNHECTHLGCKVPFDPVEREFRCPCHGSVYDEYGDNVSGPAPRPLAYHPLRLDGGQILVSTNPRPRELVKEVQFKPYA
ncbi:MAG: Rieske 2Fe-2S domain-containing protein [Chloroflexi bacterium]|nr:Rieske 2Fe-2S domain-containing protein [Chloroflexota bacterium]MDE2703414.1 Rieske 2Fe-2S domain-containing protein [Chloroflexota bacterium]MDE2863242.1 Rieske 2Fe-2S domain-containing protein [Chloroflexota bacterium]